MLDQQFKVIGKTNPETQKIELFEQPKQVGGSSLQPLDIVEVGPYCYRVYKNGGYSDGRFSWWNVTKKVEQTRKEQTESNLVGVGS